MSNHTPSHLTNNELTEALARLAKSGRDTTVGLVTHLAEFEARDLHLAAGFDSLFAYARRSCASPSTRPITGSWPRGRRGGIPAS